MPREFRGQDYSRLKKDCLKRGALFEDLEFPANSKSLYFSKVDKSIEWVRPKELCKVPRLVVEGVSCDDLNPGELGNTWFVTACSALAQEKKIWQKVVANHKEQEWDDRNTYAGIFKFSFWRFGDWIDVVIDDRLPTRDGKLVFCHSKARNEFWSALLEKAYAKLFGDYESLQYGFAADALVDFTGGVAEKLEMTRLPVELDPVIRKCVFNKLLEAADNGALIICRSECAEADKGTEGPQGLIRGQGYNVTAVKDVQVKKSLQGAVGAGSLQLVRLFNPWGVKEWTGPWSDNSTEWRRISSGEWEKMGVKFTQEGEFWMSFDDFLLNFTHVDLCHIVNKSFFTIKKSWNESILQSAWTTAGRNGGGIYESATFLSNPQYLFDITGVEDRIMVSLEQHDVKGREAMLGKMNKIGFHIMKVEENRRYRVHIPGERIFTSDYMESRSVFGTALLKKGRYVCVPTTKEPSKTGEFMLRLYSGGNSGARELKEEAPTVGCPCAAKYKLVTTITVEKCEDLALPEGVKGSLDPYVIIRCEGEKVQSQYVPQSNTAEFNIMATFYRKKPEQPIVVEVLNHHRVIDDYICEARVDEIGSETGEKKTLTLYGRKKEVTSVKPGKMMIFLQSSTDLAML